MPFAPRHILELNGLMDNGLVFKEKVNRFEF